MGDILIQGSTVTFLSFFSSEIENELFELLYPKRAEALF